MSINKKNKTTTTTTYLTDPPLPAYYFG